MLTFSSHQLSPKLVEDLCIVTGATHKHMQSNLSMPGFTIAFPRNDEGLTPSIVVQSASALENPAASLLTFYLTLSATDISPLLQCIFVFIRARRTLNKQQEENILSALHEALLNAIIHGNLGAHSDYNNTYKMFDHFAAITHMLHTKELKTITLQVEFPENGVIISVTDQGNGFSENAIVPPGESALHGRGMAIIRECCDTVDITDGGRTIIMRFASHSFPPNAPASIIKSHILIVEDVAFNRLIIQKILSQKGFKNISMAIDGVEAYEKTLKTKPDLVLLDLMLPKMDGYEYCRLIRQNAEFKDMPIVIQTILSQEEERSKAFACGASDLVTKPINPFELVARLTLHLERQELLRNLRTYQQRVQVELESACKMQDSILPGKDTLNELKTRYGITIQSLSEASSEIGGDLWGVRMISDVECAIYIADFSGHGVTAALNAFRLQAIFQSMLMEVHQPSLLMQDINLKLYELLEPGQFATMFYAVINIEKEELNYAAAGSTHPAVIRDRKTIEWLDGSGLPLGAHNKALYKTRVVPFKREDSLFLYSDALIETPNKKGELFTPQMIEAYLPAKTPQMSFKTIVNKFKEHHNETIADDLTLLFLSRLNK